jgi:aspartate/methionine/tyrosine aminotransferase
MKRSKRSDIAPFIAMDVLEAANARAAAGQSVLHLEVGEPAGGAPPAAVAAARQALEQPASLGYTEALGIPPLRQRIATHYLERYGLDVAPRDVAVTVGASGAFVLAFLAAFDVGDRVALAIPGYPCYRNILEALGIEPVPVATSLEDRFQPTVARLERLGRIDGLLLASPANPTGSMLGNAALAELAAWCRARGVRIVSDEIYHGITYDAPATSILAHDRSAIVVNGFSKYFCMTGWRLGWMVVPEDLREAVLRLAQNLFIAPATIAQHAALAAFEDRPLLDARVGSYRRNRDRLLAALREGGIEQVAPPDGAFYLYAEVSRFARHSGEFCESLLAETGIAATPGSDFDPVRGDRYVRFSFAGSEEVIAEASRRLVPWLRARAARFDDPDLS